MFRLTTLSIAILGASSLLPVCSAQALVEYGAAAAVGTAGSAGGKAVSNAIDKIFKQTGATLKASGAKPVNTKAPTAEQRKVAEAEAAIESGIPSKSRTSRTHSKPVIAGSPISVTSQNLEPPPSQESAEPALPPPPSITAEEFASIKPGATRQELLSTAGQPAYRIRISGDGHVQEFYGYKSGGVELGSVKVTDGTVTSVRQKGN